MKKSNEADVIAEHAIEDEHNLRIAAKVGLAFPSIKEKIIREFIGSLILELKERLGDQWKIADHWTSNPLKAKGEIWLSREQWQKRGRIGLECERIGPSFLLYFVWRSSTQKSPATADLKQSLDEQVFHGKQYSPPLPYGGDTVWWKYVDERYRDWNNESMLVALWKKEEAIEHYADHLVRICDVAGPLLDSLLIERP